MTAQLADLASTRRAGLQLGARFEIPEGASALQITQIIYKALHGEVSRFYVV